MKNILIHGLGQNEQSWNNTNEYLRKNQIDPICPNLFELTKNTSKDYKMMYNVFSDLCNAQKEKLNLCGISLGGILALDFAKEYPEKVNSIILIGTPYKIPKTLFKLQSIIFHIMPKSTFERMGCSKGEFITLVNSMNNLDISSDLDRIKCSSLIICGAKDNVNIESAKLLNKNIKNSKLKVISNSAHEVNIDNPKELADTIYDFWKDNQ
ncbi:alpha/beta fold hydrolase [uncultured Clostridium sp.]|uniref:alpha/beta fold hydrolase n=1 Tax=uncultured Clostridium sp. TaxID=59620 RepID=UPI002627CF9F|nr:alpha/beta hydrolase [uncultured Clostridium sp.]MCI8310118.1 alpha/beta hydrolase [Clostridia bacterium]